MRIGRPRTLLGLTLVGLGLVALPLLLAVANAVLKLGQLTTESGLVVSESATATQENQRVAGLLAGMERNARQYLVLQDQALLEIYGEDQQALENSVTLLAGLAQDEKTVTELQNLRATSRSLHGILRDGAGQGSVEQVVDGFQRMAAAARSASSGIRAGLNDRLVNLQASTRAAQQTLAWQAGLLVPGALVLVGFFALLVGRPMRQIDRAIRELGAGNFKHSIAVTGPRDIETLGRQLEWLRIRLMESTEEKNKFLRHMSHELKTPLANIREGTDLLMDGTVGTLDNQQQEVTGILRDNGVKLQKLIENLLTFSAWQTKTAALELAEFELKPLVFSVLSQHRLTISQNKIKLELHVAPVHVHADEGKLRLVLENLVSNAIKFTPKSGVIHVGAALRDETLIIEVADNGPGIAEEDRDRVFEAFYQGRRLQGGPVGGTGIGLSVVTECVQAHGGSVELVEGEWPGAHFRVQLPVARTDQKPVLVASA